jgi:hypothetical protein
MTYLAILFQEDLVVFAQGDTEDDTRHCLEASPLVICCNVIPWRRLTMDPFLPL